MSDALTRKFNTLRGFTKSSTKGQSEDTTNGSSNTSSKQSIISSSFFENSTTNVNRSQTLRPGRNTINHGMEGSMQDREPLSRSLSASQLRKQFEKPLPPPPVPTSNSMPSSPSVLDEAEATFQLLRDNTPVSSPSKPPPPPPKRSNTIHVDTRQKYATMRPTSRPSTLISDSSNNFTKDENRQSVALKSLPPVPQKPATFPKPSTEAQLQSNPVPKETENPPKDLQASQHTSVSPIPQESTVITPVTDSPRVPPPLPPKGNSLPRSTSNQSLDSLVDPKNSPQQTTPSKPPPRNLTHSGTHPTPPLRAPPYATLRNVNSARSHQRWGSVDANAPSSPTQTLKPLPPPPPRTQSTSSLSNPPPRPVSVEPVIEDEQTIMEKKEKKRTAVVNEMIATEITYIESLKKSIELYQNPLREQLASDPSKFVMDGRPLTTQDAAVVFSNIAMICGFNQQLLEELQSRQKTWNPATLIGDIFLRLTPFLKLYTEYSNNYDKASDFLKKAAKQSDAFKALFEECRYKDGQLIPPIDSLLIAPIQRIPRYNLLLSEMIKSTSQDHPDYQNLNAALTLMQEVANHINNSMKTSENFQRLVAIEDQLVNVPANWEVVIPSRIVLKDGVLTEIKHEGKKKKSIRLILFNDNLLLCRPQLLTNKLKFVFAAPILQLFTIDVSDTPAVVFCFKIQHPSRTFTVYANSSVEKQNWVQQISDARDKQMEIEGAKMVFKLLKKEEERRVLLKMKSMSTGNLSTVHSQPAMSVRAQSEIERIMMESQKMQRVKQAEEELLRKKKEQEQEDARKKKLERKMKKAARREKEKSETDPDGKEKKKKKKKKKSKDREGEKKERKHKKKKKETDNNETPNADNKPEERQQNEQNEITQTRDDDRIPSQESSEDETSQSEDEFPQASS